MQVLGCTFFPIPNLIFEMSLDLVYVLCSVLNIRSCAMDRCLQILFLYQFNYLIHVNWCRLAINSISLVFTHCRKHCIFYHFHSILLEKNFVCSKYSSLYEVCDFENWCRCVVYSVQFHSIFSHR